MAAKAYGQRLSRQGRHVPQPKKLKYADLDTRSTSANFHVDISKTSQVSDADSSKPNSEVSGDAGNGRYYALTPVNEAPGRFPEVPETVGRNPTATPGDND